MRTIFVTAYTPTRTSGRAVRTFGLVRALAALGPVDLAFVPFGGEAPDAAYAADERITLHPVHPSRGLRRALAFATTFAGGAPYSVARGASGELEATTRRLAEGHPDAQIVADSPIVATALARLARSRPVIYNAHNLEHVRTTGDRVGSVGRRRLARHERRLLRRSAESWMVSQADMDGAARLAPGARLRLVPNVVDVAAIEPLAPRAGERELVFVADLSYEPNRDAVRFLLDEALPALWQRAPDVSLTIAGRGGEGLESTDPRAVLTGFVPDLRGLYAQAGCVLVPLRHGGGSPLKFVEAMAYGLPVVATPKAAAGLEVESGVHFFCAPPDGPAFAGAILEALEGGRATEVARAGRALAEAEYSIESIVTRLGER